VSRRPSGTILLVTNGASFGPPRVSRASADGSPEEDQLPRAGPRWEGALT
jgi:hypothetical protein